jgi:hypothetical protein
MIDILNMNKKPIKIEVGQVVYNRGDMANPDHWGTITRIRGDHVEITPEVEHGEEISYPYYVPTVMICDVDEGHGGTRIVTEEAVQARRARQTGKFEEWSRRMGVIE